MLVKITISKYRMTSKKEIAQMLDISERTLRYWLNERYYEELSAIGYRKRQKTLTVNQLAHIDKILDFWE